MAQRLIGGWALGGLLVLAGCGGDNGGGPVGQGGAGAGGTPDAFTAQVQGVAASLPEESEPVAVDHIVPTTPEQAQPVEL